MCEEESEDHEAVAKLFEINDSIHRTIERYKLFKKGDIEGANKIPKGTLGKSGAGVTKGADNTLNLIDFGDPEPTAAPAASGSTVSGQQPQPTSSGNALEDDLLGLSLGSNTYGQSGGIALGGSNGSGKYHSTYPFDWVLMCLQCSGYQDRQCRSLNRHRPRSRLMTFSGLSRTPAVLSYHLPNPMLHHKLLLSQHALHLIRSHHLPPLRLAKHPRSTFNNR